jgi:hypothetical protein
MTPDELIAHFGGTAGGGVSAAARALKLAPPSIHGWIDAGEIPIDRQCQIELVTDGALKADRDEHGMPVKRDIRARSAVAVTPDTP